MPRARKGKWCSEVDSAASQVRARKARRAESTSQAPAKKARKAEPTALPPVKKARKIESTSQRPAKTARKTEPTSQSPAKKARKTGSSIGKQQKEEPELPIQATESCKYVVAIDFGTTFSGAAFAKLTDLQSKVGSRHSHTSTTDGVVIHNWPGQGEAGAKPYCKTQTSAWYMPGPKPGTFELKGWGWTGLIAYKSFLQDLNESERARMKEIIPSSRMKEIIPFCTSEELDGCRDPRNPRSSNRQLKILSTKAGHFLTRFKLELLSGKDGETAQKQLPDGLSLEKVISDYLHVLSTYFLGELRKDFGNEFSSHREIQYVLTVPAIWEVEAVATMRKCAEMAGIVGGPLCPDNHAASVHDLVIVKEPEAAAVYLHKTLEIARFRNGDKFLVVDVGGGTTDIVLHEKVGSTTRSKFIKVKELSESGGDSWGGSHVDEHFFKYVRTMIGCFVEFEVNCPVHVLEIYRWWDDIKISFDGTKETTIRLPIPGKLPKLWKRYDKKNDQPRRNSYDYLPITFQDLKGIFDDVVDKILSLINRYVATVRHLTAILMVGGFSESPYLRTKVREAFEEKCKKIVFPDDPGSAVVRGALSYGVQKEWKDMVVTRISPMTYGYDTSVPFIHGKHREDYMVRDRESQRHPRKCDNIFGVIIEKGSEVPANFVYITSLKPLYRIGEQDGENITINLYCTQNRNPLYVTDKGVRKLSSCNIPVPRRKCTGKAPKLELSVHFGTTINVSVQGENFAGKKVVMPPVEVKWTPRTFN